MGLSRKLEQSTRPVPSGVGEVAADSEGVAGAGDDGANTGAAVFVGMGKGVGMSPGDVEPRGVVGMDVAEISNVTMAGVSAVT